MKQISLRDYYFNALRLPLVIHSALFVILLIISWNDKPIHYNPILDILLKPIVLGIPQYIIFLSWIRSRYRNATVKELKKTILKSPFLFSPIYLAGFIIAAVIGMLLTNDFRLPPLFFILIILLYVIIIGYFYVALAHVIGFILKKLNMIKE